MGYRERLGVAEPGACPAPELGLRSVAVGAARVSWVLDFDSWHAVQRPHTRASGYA